MWIAGEQQRVLSLLRKQLGKPYAIGSKDPETGLWVIRGKPKISDPSPVAFDCSGLATWGTGQGKCITGGNIFLPHGTREQILFCNALRHDKPKPLDLGFASMDGDNTVDHVVIRLNDKVVIEARGHQKDRDYGKVIIRPVRVWEDWRGFLGWFRVPGIYAKDY